MLPPLSGGLHCGMISVSASNPSHCMLRPFSGSLHCGVDRKISPISRSPCSRPDGGLHCGIRHAPDGRRAQYVLPPSDGGLHCGQDNVTPIKVWARCAPAELRRAPLRPDRVVVRRVDSDHMLPPFDGGLHCSIRFVIPPVTAVTRCSRLSTAGSIAASPTAGYSLR